MGAGGAKVWINPNQINIVLDRPAYDLLFPDDGLDDLS